MTPSNKTLAQTITKTSSFQTYLTIKLLVDKPLQNNCFKAYAYFRWLDDQIDENLKNKLKRIRFIERQKQLIEVANRQGIINHLCPEEEMIVELIASNQPKNVKLTSFIHNFFAIIEFDAYRQDKTVSQAELTWYSATLSRAVTDGIEYFINHSTIYPNTAHQYDAAIGAHLAHMLRDYQVDILEGYINVPKEYLQKHQLQPTDVTSNSFHLWVEQQVYQARQHFLSGKQYINSLPVLRGKIAALWYCARFEPLLNTIERDGYLLKNSYPKLNHFNQYLKLTYLTLQTTVNHFTHVAFRKSV